SSTADALAALGRVEGRLPPDLYLDYHYLATLLRQDRGDLDSIEAAMLHVSAESPELPYLLYNLGVAHLRTGNEVAAVRSLQAVGAYATRAEELPVLADRARNGLARLAVQDQRLSDAWLDLQGIRTQGLYSNRALLGYAWTAIQQEM